MLGRLLCFRGMHLQAFDLDQETGIRLPLVAAPE